MPKKSHKKLLRKGKRSGKKSQKGGQFQLLNSNVDYVKDFFFIKKSLLTGHDEKKTSNSLESTILEILNHNKKGGDKGDTVINYYFSDNKNWNIKLDSNMKYEPFGSPFHDGDLYCQAFMSENIKQK